MYSWMDGTPATGVGSRWRLVRAATALREASRAVTVRAACSGGGAEAGAAEGVVEAVGGDHQGAACKGDGHFVCMSGQAIAEPGGAEDQSQAAEHEQQHPRSPVAAKAVEQGDRAEEGDEHREAAVDFLLSWQQMGQDRGEREKNRREQAVDHAEG